MNELGYKASFESVNMAQCLTKEIIKIVHARGHCDAVKRSLECACSDFRPSNWLLSIFIFRSSKVNIAALRPDVVAGREYFYSGTSFCCESWQGGIH